jgi:hypothetical protein
MTRTAAGLVLGGFGGALVGASARKKGGAIFLVFEAEDWADLVELNPKNVSDASKFAQRINLIARRMGGQAADREVPPAGEPGGQTAQTDTLGQLERIARLREQGMLTEEEFLQEKRKILAV